ncbi:MAG: OadG family protein [Clostridia bacterium]|nr:OadG family protein [Clostridia bacterium]
MLNLLNNVAEQTREVSIGEVSVYALLGYSVVFAGIVFLIFVLWAVGKVMSKTKTAPKKEKTAKAPVPVTVNESLAVADAGETISEETVAVIMAALTAYYQTVGPKCEFTVKRIKRI